MEHRIQILQKIRNRKIRILKSCFSCFDLTHIQNIVNDPQQVLRGYVNFIYILQYLDFIPCIMPDQSCNTNNRIHGCADVMGHIGQKICFRLICIFRCL